MDNNKVKLVTYDNNKGKGHALKMGFLRVTGQFTFFIDGDLEIRAKELLSFVAGLGSSDIVIGSKRHPDSSVHAPVVRRVLSLGFNFLERLLTGVKATDTQAGVKAAKSSVLYKILPLLSVKKYAFDAELLAVASLLNFRIEELPVEVKLAASFKLGEVFRMFVDLLGISYRLRVKRWYQQNACDMSNTYKPIIPW